MLSRSSDVPGSRVVSDNEADLSFVRTFHLTLTQIRLILTLRSLSLSLSSQSVQSGCERVCVTHAVTRCNSLCSLVRRNKERKAREEGSSEIRKADQRLHNACLMDRIPAQPGYVLSVFLSQPATCARVRLLKQQRKETATALFSLK